MTSLLQYCTRRCYDGNWSLVLTLTGTVHISLPRSKKNWMLAASTERWLVTCPMVIIPPDIAYVERRRDFSYTILWKKISKTIQRWMYNSCDEPTPNFQAYYLCLKIAKSSRSQKRWWSTIQWTGEHPMIAAVSQINMPLCQKNKMPFCSQLYRLEPRYFRCV